MLSAFPVSLSVRQQRSNAIKKHKQQLTELSSNLHQLSHPRNRARLTRILMPDDSFTNTLSLRPRSPKALQLLQRHETTVPLERHVSIAAVLIRSGNIMIQTSQSPGFKKVALGSSNPLGEVL